ncbi:hypothetical protein JXQ31_16275 [candidate division KSB1 bacterium]|nr:hypothetical protein [candidate division KSB1 bacterium]
MFDFDFQRPFGLYLFNRPACEVTPGSQILQTTRLKLIPDTSGIYYLRENSPCKYEAAADIPLDVWFYIKVADSEVKK